MSYKVYLKTRNYDDHVVQYLLIKLPDSGSKTIKLEDKLPIIRDTYSKAEQKAAQKKLEERTAIGEDQRKKLDEILNKFGFTFDEFLKLNKSQSISEIHKNLAEGKSKKDLTNKSRYNDMLFSDFVEEYVKKIDNNVPERNKEGKLVLNKKRASRVANYEITARKFFESVGYYTLSEQITYQTVEDFITYCNTIDLKNKELGQENILNIIRLHSSLLKDNTSIQAKHIEDYAKQRKIYLRTVKNPRSERTARTPVEETLANRIMGEWWIFLGKKIKLVDLTEDHLKYYVKYLEKMKPNVYWDNLKTIINYAQDRFIIADITRFIDPPAFPQQEQRAYLTTQEIIKLNQTEWPAYWVHRLAFLFSTQTGLRLVDIKKLQWKHITSSGLENIVEDKAGEIIENNDGQEHKLTIKQSKTKSYVTVPLTRFARQVLSQLRPQNPLPDDFVFVLKSPPHTRTGINGTGYGGMNANFWRWLEAAGVKDKHITYHCSRHTFCQNLIDADVDGFVVSELMGHRDLNMVRTYMRINAQKKQAALDKLPVLDLRPEFVLKRRG